MEHCGCRSAVFSDLRFESSVNLWGTQTSYNRNQARVWFESSVNLWGTQTAYIAGAAMIEFESSVNLWGTQT